MRPASLLLAALPLAGCSDVFGEAAPEIAVSFGAQHALSAPVRLRAELGGRTVELRTSGPAEHPTVTLRTPATGALPVHLQLIAGTGETITSLDFNQEIHPNSRNWLTVQIGTVRGMDDCGGVDLAAPLPPAMAPDSVFVDIGSLPDNAIC